MKLDHQEESRERRRLSGQLHARGRQTGISTAGMFLFGLPFVGVGIWATLAGAKIIPIDPSRLHAPYWILAAFGSVFGLGGVMLWSMGWRQLQASRRHKQVLARPGSDPALADYPWNPRGFTPPRWSRAGKTVGAVVFFAVFLSMFNWWAFAAKGPWMLKAIVCLFDLMLVFAVWQAAVMVGRTVKFGGSRLEFPKFPFRPGEPVTLRWRVPQGVSRIARGNFTLRCVEEWYEVRGSGKNRSRSLVQEQVWSASSHLDHPQEILAGKLEELRFNPPADAPSTALSKGKPVFWELVVDLDLAGLDFHESYLVPVYRTA